MTRRALVVALAAFVPCSALAEPAMCSPLDKAPVTDPWDNAACCDGVVSDDGCGPQDCSDTSPERTCGKPVDVLTGFMWVYATDAHIPAPVGPAVAIRRTYSSAWAQSAGGRAPGVLGAGWSHGYSSRLELSGPNPSSAVTFRRSDGGTVVFTWGPDKNYHSRHVAEMLRFDPGAKLYSLEHLDGETELFDARGRLTRIRDADGGEVQLWYAGDDALCSASATRPAGQLCRADFVFGSRLWFWYVSTGAGVRLDYVSLDAAGGARVASYSYDADGSLTSATQMDNTTLTYAYGFTHHFPRGPSASVRLLTKVTDAEGFALESFTYRQRPVSQSRVEGHTTQDDSFGLSILPERHESGVARTDQGESILTWKNGRVRTRCSSGSDGNRHLDRCQEYDVPNSLDEPMCERNADGYFTRTERDTLGRATSVVRGMAACQVPSAAEAATATTYGYVSHSNRQSFEQRPSVDPAPPANFRAATVYDFTLPVSQVDPFCGQASCQTPSAYNKEGSLAAQVQQVLRIGRTAAIDGTWSTRVTAVKFEYSPLGQLLRRSGPRRDVDDSVGYSYFDAASGGPEAGRLKAVNRGSVVIASYADYAPSGKARQITDEAGNVTHLEYDAAGRVLWVQRPTSIGRMVFAYRPSGALSKVTFPSGRWISFLPDTLGRVGTIEWRDDAGALVEKLEYVRGLGQPNSRVTQLKYYSKTTLVRRASFAYMNGVLAGESADGADTFRFIDEEGRVASISEGSSAGKPELSNVWYLYDAMGELNQVKRLVSGQQVEVARFGRDVQRNVVSVTDAAGIEIRYQYDDFGNLLESTSSTTGTRRYAYDEAGNLVKERTPDGSEIARTYDARNRLLTVHGPDVEERITHDSDQGAAILDCATGQVLGPSRGAGRRTKVEDASGATFFGYTANPENSARRAASDRV